MYKLYTDGGHAWLRVPKKELAELGLENKISGYSYEKGDCAYLEEDCDAGLFIVATGLNPAEVEEVYHDTSPVRQFAHYQVNRRA